MYSFSWMFFHRRCYADCPLGLFFSVSLCFHVWHGSRGVGFDPTSFSRYSFLALPSSGKCREKNRAERRNDIFVLGIYSWRSCSVIAAAPTSDQTMTGQPPVSPCFIMLWTGRNFILQVQIFEDF